MIAAAQQRLSNSKVIGTSTDPYRIKPGAEGDADLSAMLASIAPNQDDEPTPQEINLPVTTADNGYQQNPTLFPTLFYDITTSGRPAIGIVVSCEDENVSVYTDTLGTSSSPITITAGAPPVQLMDLSGGIRRAWVFGPTLAKFTWNTNIR